MNAPENLARSVEGFAAQPEWLQLTEVSFFGLIVFYALMRGLMGAIEKLEQPPLPKSLRKKDK